MYLFLQRCGFRLTLRLRSAPRDDLESLGYVLFYHFFGDLPWRGDTWEGEESKTYMHYMVYTYAYNQVFSRMLPFAYAPPELNDPMQLAQAFTNGDIRPSLRTL